MLLTKLSMSGESITLRRLIKMINIIHQVHLNGDPNPEFLKSHEKLKEVAPDCEVKLWGDDASLALAEEYGIKELYEGYPHWVFRADIARVLAVHKFGGWYFDMDFAFYKNPMELVDDASFAAVQMLSAYGYPFENSVFYSEPGHPILDFYIKHINERRKVRNPIVATGPYLFGDAVKSAIDQVKIIPYEYFFSDHVDGSGKPGIYGTHFHAKTWVNASEVSTK
jgi:mannosyltransferase OCH1-like enzyme